jgi:tetratricopeptide (TPR) repeat protein
MRRLRARALAAGFLLAGGLAGCAKGPVLPQGIARAQEGERGQDAEQALARWTELVERCRRGDVQGLDVKRKDDCGLAAYRRAQALEDLGRDEAAEQAFRQVRELSRDRERIGRAQLRAAALLQHKLGRRDEAAALLLATLRELPDELAGEDALNELVRLRRAAGDAEPARKEGLGRELDTLAEALRKHESAGGFALYHAARFYEDKGQTADALGRYDELARRYPKGPLLDDALFAAAQLLRRERRPAEAAQRLERLQAGHQGAVLVGHYHQPRLIESVLLLGQLYLDDLRQPERAIKTLERLLSWQPTSVLADDALLVMARAAWQRPGRAVAERRDEACGYLVRLLRDFPDSNQRRAVARLQSELGCTPSPGRS